MSVGESGNKLPYKSVNYSVLECMKYGGIPIVRNKSLVDGLITKENVIIVDEENIVNSISEKVNFVMKNFNIFSEMKEKNFDLLKREFDHVMITKKYIDLITGENNENIQL